MALTRSRYRRLPELYVTGTTVTLLDGQLVWLQALNPFQRDEASRDAQVARARLINALKSKHGGEERDLVTASFLTEGRDAAVQLLISARLSNKLGKILLELRDDPDWSERMTVMERSDDLQARPSEDAERKLLTDYNAQYLAEINKRQDVERDYLRSQLEPLEERELLEEYVETYLERRGDTVAGAEFALTELWYSARVCAGATDDTGKVDHQGCENHYLTLFETKAEVRDQPEALQDLLYDALKGLAMAPRDARFSDRQGSSSQSSPLPSEEAASTPSTPSETPSSAPGISTSPSATL